MRILVVDDNVDAADTFALMLRDEGHQVRTAYNGREVIDAALREPPDILFLDIGLPGMNGYEVARVMRSDARFNDTYIVALTAYGGSADKADALAAGIDMHLTKPAEPAAIDAVLENARRARGAKAL